MINLEIKFIDIVLKQLLVALMYCIKFYFKQSWDITYHVLTSVHSIDKDPGQLL